MVILYILQHSWICWNKITGWIWGFFSRRGTNSLQWYYSKLKIPYLNQFLWYGIIFCRYQLPLVCSFQLIIKKTSILRTSKLAKNMTSSLWRHTFNLNWHFSWKNNWLLVFLFTKFGVERVNTFEVIQNNANHSKKSWNIWRVVWPLRVGP